MLILRGILENWPFRCIFLNSSRWFEPSYSVDLSLFTSTPCQNQGTLRQVLLLRDDLLLDSFTTKTLLDRVSWIHN